MSKYNKDPIVIVIENIECGEVNLSVTSQMRIQYPLILFTLLCGGFFSVVIDPHTVYFGKIILWN